MKEKGKLFIKERDIILNSEYIIHYFNKQNKRVTNLTLEKLLYFYEAIYMVISGDERLFNEEFYAWDFGPVNKIVYNKYKKFGRASLPDTLTTDIDPINNYYISILYSLFKDYTAFDLVSLSHSEGSPWDEINKESKGNPIDKSEIINKAKTKAWFEKIINYED